jgi:HEAT repeat protein
VIPRTSQRLDPSVRACVEALCGRYGESVVVEGCTALLAGAPPEDHPRIAAGLSAHDATVGELRTKGWREYWWRTWGARGLLYVWSDSAVPAVVDGLADPHWRPAEMCLKVAAAHEVAEAAEGAVLLTGHRLPRVRAAAVRALGLVGDTEHVAEVRSALADTDLQVRRAAALAMERMVERLDLPEEELP